MRYISITPYCTPERDMTVNKVLWPFYATHKRYKKCRNYTCSEESIETHMSTLVDLIYFLKFIYHVEYIFLIFIIKLKVSGVFEKTYLIYQIQWVTNIQSENTFINDIYFQVWIHVNWLIQPPIKNYHTKYQLYIYIYINKYIIDI